MHYMQFYAFGVIPCRNRVEIVVIGLFGNHSYDKSVAARLTKRIYDVYFIVVGFIEFFRRGGKVGVSAAHRARKRKVQNVFALFKQTFEIFFRLARVNLGRGGLRAVLHFFANIGRGEFSVVRRIFLAVDIVFHRRYFNAVFLREFGR